jgi:hypothetical protein
MQPRTLETKLLCGVLSKPEEDEIIRFKIAINEKSTFQFPRHVN